MTRHCVRLLAALVLAAHFSAGTGSAAVIVDQNTGLTSDGSTLSQIFPDEPTFSTKLFDNFTTAIDYNLTTLTVFGDEEGIPSENIEVRADITTTADFSAVPVLSVVGTQVGSNLVFDFGGAFLGAGSYFVTAYVNRPFGTGGQWFWLTTPTINSPQAIFHNPGGGFGEGTSPIAIERLFGSPSDLMFVLNGEPVQVNPTGVPEPATLASAALGVAGLLIVRRRRASR